MLSRAFAIAAVLIVAGCDKPTDENIDKWLHTQKGPDKLQAAFTDDSLTPDLAAHAAANLVKLSHEAEVRAGFDQMSQGRRTSITGKLAPRLWELARVESDNDQPRGDQISAKDMLYEIRKYADADTQKTIDGYLVDWYCVPSYEARAGGGAYTGPKVLRTIGAPAAKKMISAVNGIVANPKNKLADAVFLGLAAIGTQDTVKYLLDIAKMTNRPDKTLANRATDALELAFVRNEALFDVAPPDGLAGNINQLAALVKDEDTPPHAANNATDLIRAIGAPGCLQPLLDMIGYPHKAPEFTYMAAQNALVCGGPKAIGQVIGALPDGEYDQAAISGALIVPTTKMSPKDQVVAAWRALLDDKRVITRWSAMEALGALKSKDDAPKIAAITDKTKLVGYWGDQSNFEPKDRKADPTLGDRAKAIAAALNAGTDLKP